MTDTSLYERVGGHETFRQLVHEFYQGVAADPDFRAMYPEDDLGPAEDRLRMFLEQYFGGPKTYQEQRGHPRLRLRHNPFPVDSDARDTWLRHMLGALETLDIPEDDATAMRDYFVYAAQFMINTGETA